MHCCAREPIESRLPSFYRVRKGNSIRTSLWEIADIVYSSKVRATQESETHAVLANGTFLYRPFSRSSYSFIKLQPVSGTTAFIRRRGTTWRREKGERRALTALREATRWNRTVVKKKQEKIRKEEKEREGKRGIGLAESHERTIETKERIFEEKRKEEYRERGRKKVSSFVAICKSVQVSAKSNPRSSEEFREKPTKTAQ